MYRLTWHFVDEGVKGGCDVDTFDEVEKMMDALEDRGTHVLSIVEIDD